MAAADEASLVLYGPISDINPYEYIGLRHNDIVHAGMRGLTPRDTVSVEAGLRRFDACVAEWGSLSGLDQHDIDTFRSVVHSATIAADRRRELSTLTSTRYTDRELRYLRRIGKALSLVGTFEEVERELLAVEMDIMSEHWHTDNHSELAALVAISVAKHSFAYWKRIILLSYGQSDAVLGKSVVEAVDILIEATTATEIITAADVMGALAGAQHFQPFGVDKAIIGAIVVGGSSSLMVAGIVYHDRIVAFFRRLLSCN